MKEWSNWSGSLKFVPKNFLLPASEDELCSIVNKHYHAGRKIRLSAAGHSSSPLVVTNETLVHLGNFKGIISVDNDQQSVTLRAGMTVHESNSALQERQLALFNTGDVDVQTLAGAISTGTHGSGRKLQNLASVLVGATMIDYKGEVHRYDEQTGPEIMKAMRVSLGAFGIFSAIKVKVVPLFRLHRMELFTDTETCLKNFSLITEGNRNVDFYWYPRRDECKIRILNEPGKGDTKFSFKHHCVKTEEGFVGEILPRKRELKFEEMEYALPMENGIECFREVRERMKSRHRKDVAWRVLVRCIDSDSNYLSPHYGRESISISLHHNAGLPYKEFFSDIEPIFIRYGGRPHWAKKHSLLNENLRGLYPEWNNFQEIRKALDPEGFFLNPYLRKLFGV